MIDYDVNNHSPFYKANESYCKKLEENFNASNVKCTGYCDSYGYEIIANFVHANFTYELKCYKYQIPRNGVIIPENAAEYLGIDINASGFRNNISVDYGRNWFHRFFMNSFLKSATKYPYYFQTNQSFNHAQIQALLNFFSYYKIIRFRLQQGKLQIKIFSAFTKPVKIVEDMEKGLPFLF